MGTKKDFFCIDPYSRRTAANYPFAVSGIGALFTLYIALILMAKDKCALHTPVAP